MPTLDRYIRKTVLLAMLMVLLVLGGLDFIFTLLDEFSETGDGYGLMDAVWYVLLTFPRHIYELLPMASMIGALVGLGVLASGSELVVMQSSGVKVGRIVWAVMKPAALLMVLGLFLGEYVAPAMEVRAEVGKSRARGETIAWSASGYWQRDENDYVHFSSIDPEGVLYGLNIYRYDDEQRLRQSIIAETARYRGGAQWRLEDAVRISFTDSDGTITSSRQHFDTLSWEMDLSPEVLQLMITDPDNLAISDLYRYAGRFREQGQDAGPYLLAFWKKVMQPLTAGALVLVAVSFIFGPLRGTSMGARIFTGICFGLTFIIFQRLFGTVALVYQLSPFFGVLVPILLSTLAGLYLLRRVP